MSKSKTTQKFFSPDTKLAQPFNSEIFMEHLAQAAGIPTWQLARFMFYVGRSTYSMFYGGNRQVTHVGIVSSKEIGALEIIDSLTDNHPYEKILSSLSNFDPDQVKLYFSPEIFEFAGTEAVIEKYCGNGFFTIDTRHPDSPVSTDMKTKKIVYRGEVSKRLENTYVKTAVSNAVNKMMSTPLFIEPPYRVNGTITNAVIENLVDAITFGNAKVSMPKKSGSGRKLRGRDAEILSNIVFEKASDDMTDNDMLFQAQKFSDYTALWLEVMQQQKYYALTIAPKDLVDDFEGVKEALQNVSSIMGMDTFIEAYEAGVPISDIVG